MRASVASVMPGAGPGGTDAGLDASVRLRRGGLELDVTLQVAPDEVVAVLGPNGAGKTTLLRAVAGLLALDDGHVRVAGRVLDDPHAGVLVPPEGRPIGMVFQDHLLFPFLDARDNVAFGLRARGVPRSEARRRAEDWLDRLGLADRARAKPSELSGGEAQRVALARALATEPALLLLDEPLAALDAATRADVRRSLRRHLADVGGARVVVTHDPVDAAVLADRLVVVEHGRVVQTGTLTQVAATPRSRYVAELVGTNLCVGVARDGVVRGGSGAELVIADRAVSGDVLVAVAPRAVSLFPVTLDDPPVGSPRNHWRVRVVELDALVDRVRVRLDGPWSLVAEVTPAGAADLGLRSGTEVWALVKATDVAVYPA